MAGERADQELVVGEFEKNKRGETIRVSLRRYKGVALLDVRTFYQAGDGELRGTAKGVSIKPTLLPRLRDLLEEAEREARARGLL